MAQLVAFEERPRWSCVGWQRRCGVTEAHEVQGAGIRRHCQWFVKVFRNEESGRIVVGALEHGHGNTAQERDRQAETWWRGARDFDLQAEVWWKQESSIVLTPYFGQRTGVGR